MEMNIGKKEVIFEIELLSFINISIILKSNNYIFSMNFNKEVAKEAKIPNYESLVSWHQEFKMGGSGRLVSNNSTVDIERTKKSFEKAFSKYDQDIKVNYTLDQRDPTNTILWNSCELTPTVYFMNGTRMALIFSYIGYCKLRGITPFNMEMKSFHLRWRFDHVDGETHESLMDWSDSSGKIDLV